MRAATAPSKAVIAATPPTVHHTLVESESAGAVLSAFSVFEGFGSLGVTRGFEAGGGGTITPLLAPG